MKKVMYGLELEDLYRYSHDIDAHDLANYGAVGKIKLPKPGEEQHTSKLKCRLKEWILVRKEESDTYPNGIKKEEGTIRQLDDTDWYEFTVGNCDVYLIARYSNYGDYKLHHFLKNPITNQYDRWKSTDVSIEEPHGIFELPSYYAPPTGYHFAKYDERNSGDEIAGRFDLYYDLNQYTVTLNANGGSVGTGSVTTTWSKGDYCNLSWNTPTRTGYIFDGWYTQASGGTKVYNADGSCTNEGTYWNGSLWKHDGNATFYAHWIPINYTIAYNGNGATEGSTSSTNHTYDKSTNLATNGFKRKYTVTFDGNGGKAPTSQTSEYTFHRWRQYANNTGWEFTNAQTNVGNLSSTNNSTVTLYAQWNPTAITLPVATKNAYNLEGWYEGTTKVGKAGEKYTPTKNTALRANWTLATHNIEGTINWIDEENKYNSRPKNSNGVESVELRLTSDEPVTENGALKTPFTLQTAGNKYTINNLQTLKVRDNTQYRYTVNQTQTIPGYETTYNGYNITNTLIKPYYTSNISYTPIDSFQNTALKNGKIRVTAQATANNGNRAGLHEGIATFTIDNGININKDTINIQFYEASTGTTKTITDYTINNNVITVNYGKNASGVTDKGDSLTIQAEGTLTKIGNYSSNIVVTGKLKDLRGEKTNINLGQVTTKTENLNVANQLPKAKIQLTKKDSITEEKLTNATFTLYEWNGSQYVEKETIRDTNQDGIYESKVYEWNSLTQGKYKIAETNIPENHKNLDFSMIYQLNELKTEDYTITPDYTNSNYTIKYSQRNPDDFDRTNGVVENEPYKIKAAVDLLDEETKQQIQNEATFKIYEWDNTTNTYKPYTSYTTGNEVKMTRLPNKSYQSQEWLYYTKTNEGKFRIVEEKAPTGYVLKQTSSGANKTYDINILQLVGNNGSSNEQTINITNSGYYFTNERAQGEITLNKVDSQTKGIAQGDAKLEGAVYELYAKENIYHADGKSTNYEDEPALLYKQDELIQTATTDSEGKIVFKNIECGKYYIKEKTASTGYKLNSASQDIQISYKDQNTKTIKENVTFEETVKKQAFQICQITSPDRDEYELLQNTGYTIYKISDLSIVKDGKITKNSDGTYTVNDPTAINDAKLKQYANKKGTYNIQDLINYYYKIDNTEGSNQIPHDENSYHPYNINEPKVKDYSTSSSGIEIPELRPDNDGYIRSPELAFGEYIVIQTTVANDVETARPIYINITEDSRQAQKLKYVTSADFEAKVKLNVKDSNTGKNILQSGIKYVIYDEEGELITHHVWDDEENEYIEYGTLDHPFSTGSKGIILTPVTLPIGKYTVKEVDAPIGYVLKGEEGYTQNGELIQNPQIDTSFEISTAGVYYTDDFLDTNIITINQSNESQVGTLKLTTEGEALSEANVAEDGNYNFKYGTKNIQGVTFEVRAKEDIVTQDGYRSVLYNKDEVIKTITTNEDGIAYADNLPIGKYYLKQTVAGNGYVLNQEQKEFEITYGANNQELVIGSSQWKKASQETPVRNVDNAYTNKMQNLKIILTKTDEKTAEPIQGAVIGLYTKKAIVNTQNEEIIPQDTLILQQTTNEEGKIVFENNLPIGEYYVKEIKAPNGYMQTTTKKDIIATYDALEQNQEVKEIEITLNSSKTGINVLKENQSESNLVGAKLEIRNRKNETLKTWTTTEEAENIQGLNINEDYQLVETKPSEGYVTADNIVFRINDQGEIQTSAKTKANNTIIMQDEPTKVQIDLLDAKTKEKVQGGTIKLLKTTNEQTEEIAKWTTSEESKIIEGLPIGTYTLVEEKVPDNQGYVTSKQVQISIQDTPATQKFEMLQERTRLQIKLQDKDTNKQIEGATLQIVKIEQETDEQGQQQESQEIMQEFTTTDTPYYIEQLPIGNYILRQIQVPNDQGYISMEDKKFEIIDSNELQEVSLVSDETTLQVNLVDEESAKQIEDATLQIVRMKNVEGEQGYEIQEEVVKEFVTTKEPYIVSKLPIGTYKLREIKTNKEQGQVTAKEVEFEINDTKELQTVTMVQGYSKIEIELLDKETKEKLQGVNFEIYKVTEKEDGTKETTNKVGDFTTGEENYKTTKLPVGSYILREPKEQKEALLEKGYATLEDTAFEVTDTLEWQKVEVEQDYTKLEVEVLDKNTKEKLKGVNLELIQVFTKDGQKQGKIIRKFTTGETNYTETRLPVGQYILREPKEQKEALLDKGYITSKDVSFEIKDTNQVQKQELQQEETKIEIKILDKDTKQPVEGVTLQLKNKETGKIVATWDTTKDAYILEKLPVGTYILEQTKINKEQGQVITKPIEIKVEDKSDIQPIEMTQSVTRVELQLYEDQTTLPIDGVKLQIRDKETGEIVKTFVSTDGVEVIERLPVGTYILEEVESPGNKGYVKNEPIEFTVTDEDVTQKIQMYNKPTKVIIGINDPETGKPIEGSTLQVVDKKTGEVLEEWISGSEPKEITKLPVGEYLLVQKDAPGKDGYANSDPVEFEITDEESATAPKIEMKGKYTKTEIKISGDFDTGLLDGVILVVKDKDGNVIMELDGKDGKYVLEKLPAGTYTIESKNTPYGYKKIYGTLEIGINGEGKVELKLEKENFDIQVETWIQEITRNGKNEYTNKIEEQKLRKVDIKDKNIQKEEVKIAYKIRIKNVGKINGQVGVVVCTIPQGMEFKKEDNKTYLKEENGKIITTDLAGKYIKEGQYAEIPIVLRWKNGLENFGTKEILVALGQVTSDIGFKETNTDNNKAKSAGVIIGVTTGVMNLVWTCWVLIIALIIVEIFVSKKMKVKNFKIKDRTLKYRKNK